MNVDSRIKFGSNSDCHCLTCAERIAELEKQNATLLAEIKQLPALSQSAREKKLEAEFQSAKARAETLEKAIHGFFTSRVSIARLAEIAGEKNKV